MHFDLKFFAREEMQARSGVAPKFSGHAESPASESDDDAAAYAATWDRGISKLPQPSAEERARRTRCLRGFGCGTVFLGETFFGTMVQKVRNFARSRSPSWQASEELCQREFLQRAREARSASGASSSDAHVVQTSARSALGERSELVRCVCCENERAKCARRA